MKTLSHVAGLAYLRLFMWKFSSHLSGIPAKSSESHLGGLALFSYEYIVARPPNRASSPPSEQPLSF